MQAYQSRSIKRIAATILFAVALIVLPQEPSAQAEPQPQDSALESGGEPNSGETTAVEAVNDMIFLSSENLTVSQSTTDDLLAAGNQVEVAGASADHLFLAGGEIDVSSASVHDLFAAGGELRLSNAEIIDDIVVAGGEITTMPDFVIGGSAVLASGTARVESPIGGNLRIMAGDIFVNSTIAGTARLSGDTITLGPKARIAGDLLYRTENLTVDPGAIIEGRRLVMAESENVSADDFGIVMGRFAVFLGLSIIVSYLTLVLLLALFAPRLMKSTAGTMWDKPWQSLGIGVLYALIVPLLAILLAWSVVGLPLVFLLVVLSLVLTALALAATAYFTGMGIRRLATSKAEPPERIAGRVLWPLLGAVVIFALTMIPLAGVLIWLLAMLFGLGAFAMNFARIAASSESIPAPA